MLVEPIERQLAGGIAHEHAVLERERGDEVGQRIEARRLDGAARAQLPIQSEI